MPKKKISRAERATEKASRIPALANLDDLAQSYVRDLVARIRAALKAHNITELAPQLGISRSAIYDWTAGRHLPDVERMFRLAAYLKVSLSWLLTGDGSMNDREHLIGNYFLPAEALHLGNATRTPPLAFRRDWLVGLLRSGADLSDCFLAEVKDDSMEPTLSRDEILLVRSVRHADTAVPITPADGLYLFKGGIVRRVQWQIDGSAVISCDNTKYPFEPRKIGRAPERSEDFIIGRVVWCGGRI